VTTRKRLVVTPRTIVFVGVLSLVSGVGVGLLLKKLGLLVWWLVVPGVLVGGILSVWLGRRGS
jgi:hypothetical protein